MSAFSEFDHQFSDFIPFSFRFFFLVEHLFVSDPSPRNDQCPAGNLVANKDTSVESFRLIVFTSPYRVIEHRHEDNSSLELFGFAHFVHELWDFLDELQWSDSWEIFHSNSIGSPSIVSKILYCDGSLNQSNCRSQAVFDVGF